MLTLNRSDHSRAREAERFRENARKGIEALIGAAQAQVTPVLPAQVPIYAEKEAQARAVIDLGVAAHHDDPDLYFVADEVDLRGGTMIEAAQRIVDAADADRGQLREIEKVRMGANVMAEAAQTAAEAESAVVWCRAEIEGLNDGNA